MTIPKNEAGLKAKLIKALPSDYLAIAHSDLWKSGIPDLSISGHGRTSWWELKHATPNFATKEIQEITCLRLAKLSFCRYIIYYEHDGSKETLIVHPNNVRGRRGVMRDIAYEVWIKGFDHASVVRYIQAVHDVIFE